MPWTHVHPDAYLDWAVPGNHTDAPIPTRKTDWTLPEAVLLASHGTRSNSFEQPIPLAEPGSSRPHSCAPGLGRCIHVGRSKNVHSPVGGRQASSDQPDDAVDVAADDDVLLFFPTQRSLPVLGGIQPDSNGYSILYYRLGEPVPIQESGACSPNCPGPAGQGDGARWRHWK